MKKHLAFLIILLAFLSAACSLPASLRRTAEVAPEAVTPTGQAPEAALKAQIVLGQNLDVDTSQILITAYEPAQWNDTCLGIQLTGDTCTQEDVQGWVVDMKYDDTTFIFHTDEDGSIVRQVQGVIDPGPIAQQSAQLLAGLLGYKPEAIQVLSETPTTFDNTCLELVTPGLLCQAIPTRGEVVRLEADGQVFEMRSENNPIAPVIAEIEGVTSTTAAITWTSANEDSSQCSNLVAYLNNVVIHYDCSDAGGREPGISSLTPVQQSQLIKWFITLQTFETTQPIANGELARLYFSAIGKTPPTEDERKQIFQYTNDLLQDLFLSRPTPSTYNLGP